MLAVSVSPGSERRRKAVASTRSRPSTFVAEGGAEISELTTDPPADTDHAACRDLGGLPAL